MASRVLCLSLKSLQSPCYQQWASLTKHPGSKHLVKNNWDIQCLLTQDTALGFSQVLASFLPTWLVNSAFAVKAGQRLGYLVTNNIYSWSYTKRVISVLQQWAQSSQLRALTGTWREFLVTELFLLLLDGWRATIIKPSSKCCRQI